MWFRLFRKTEKALGIQETFPVSLMLFCDKQNDKPGYVVNNHLSSPAVAGRLKRPTWKRDGQPHCFLFGLASDGVYICPSCYQESGSLLHCPSTLTGLLRRYISVALSLESPPPDVIWHPALWSPDFPHLTPFGTVSRDYLFYLSHEVQYIISLQKK